MTSTGDTESILAEIVDPREGMPNRILPTADEQSIQETQDPMTWAEFGKRMAIAYSIALIATWLLVWLSADTSVMFKKDEAFRSAERASYIVGTGTMSTLGTILITTAVGLFLWPVSSRATNSPNFGDVSSGNRSSSFGCGIWALFAVGLFFDGVLIFFSLIWALAVTFRLLSGAYLPAWIIWTCLVGGVTLLLVRLHAKSRREQIAAILSSMTAEETVIVAGVSVMLNKLRMTSAIAAHVLLSPLLLFRLVTGVWMAFFTYTLLYYLVWYFCFGLLVKFNRKDLPLSVQSEAIAYLAQCVNLQARKSVRTMAKEAISTTEKGRMKAGLGQFLAIPVVIALLPMNIAEAVFGWLRMMPPFPEAIPVRRNGTIISAVSLLGILIAIVATWATPRGTPPVAPDVNETRPVEASSMMDDAGWTMQLVENTLD